MLAISDLTISFGGVKALEDVSLVAQTGEILGIIGPNGSGKSTLINVISGFYRPTGGRVELDGESLTGLSPQAIRRRGVVRTFQNLRLVDEMTVIENAAAGLYLEITHGKAAWPHWIGAVLGLPSARTSAAAVRARAADVAGELGLRDRLHVPVAELSYGEQKRLELARALAIRPKVLVLDEPTAGMGVDEADELISMVAALTRSAGSEMTLVLIEHRLDLVLRVSDHVTVLDSGRVVAAGPPSAIAEDPEVHRIYVGGE